MIKRHFIVLSLIFFSVLSLTFVAQAQVNARMFRYPDISSTHITFVYAGDIWVVPKQGGLAHRLSSPAGEEMFPRFSPDGSQISFSGNYDGNVDVYVIPTLGGHPVRVTHHPMPDRLIDWRPSGKGLLIASSRESGRQRYNQFYTVSPEGGLPEKLPIPYGEFGSFSSDEKLLAYTPSSIAFRTWKRYRGGLAPEIWLFDLSTKSARNITENAANDDFPMWYGPTLYFLSDRGPNQRQNIWKYDPKSQEMTQVTHFKDYDISAPSIGPSDIVFEAGGRLHLLNLKTEEYREVEIDVVTDMATLKPRMEKVANFIESGGISPSGKRAVFEARGDIFSVPAEHGFIRNLTQRSGSAERFPAWSPYGKHIAYWSDKSGEYELYIRASDGSGEEEKLTELGQGFRYQLFWSPDSKKIAFIDHRQTIQIYEMETKNLIEFDTLNWLMHPILSGFEVSWSADSNWIAYSKALDNYQSAIFLFDFTGKKRHQVTSGYYNDSSPVFDPDGKYLYFLTDRSLSPIYSPLDETWIYANSTRIVSAALRKDVPSPLPPRNDAEPVEEEKPKEEKPEKKEEPKKQEKPEKPEEKKPEPVKIDLGGFENRVIVLPPNAGNYSTLRAVKGQVVFHRRPRTGSDDRDSPIVAYDLEKREEDIIVDDADGFEISADGKKMLVANNRTFYIIDLKPKQKLTKKLRTDELEMTIDPRAEWKQMFMDVWRKYRDFFYDPGMHEVDWEAVRRQYGTLLKDAVTRWDVNFILGEIMAELNASHTYVGGGELERPKEQNVGLLGIDWSLENGAYRIARIIDGAPWDSEARSPFKLPGVNVKEGDYILAVNGIPLDTKKDPWAAFEGLASKTVALTINDKPMMEGAEEVIVETLNSETRLRHLEWIEKNRRRVDEASNGRVGYIYMPNTSFNGQTELIRQFYGQLNKDGFIIDERFNSGGQLADRFIELLSRPRVHYLAWRHGKEIQQPFKTNPGPKVMLINGWSGSGGDALPFTFQDQGVGPVIGMRTMGALIGPAIGHRLVDGGYYTVPEGRIYSNKGEWFAEGHGVTPDIEVVDHPSELAKGVDPQLERAVQEVLRMLEADPPKRVGRPAYQGRTAKGIKK